MKNLRPYPAYKPTGLAWLPEVPREWEMLRGKFLFTKMERPVRPQDEVVTCFRDGEVTLRKNRRLEGFTESLKEIGYQGVRKGDLVIHVMDAFAGSVGVSDSDGKSTPVYSVCVPKKSGINNYYYAHIVRVMAKTGYIQSLYRGIRERSSDFRFEVFGNQFLPVPPPAEQEAIVAYLDEKTAKIDRLIELKEREIKLLNEKKQAVISKVVTRGLDPNAELVDSGVDWIGKVPRGWKKDRLKYVAQSNLRSLSEKTDPTWKFRYLDIGSVGTGYVKVDPENYSFADSPSRARRLVDEGDTIVSTVRTYLKSVLFITSEYKDCVVSTGFSVLKPNLEKVTARFLGCVLMSDYFVNSVILHSTGVSYPAINDSTLSALPVVLPPLSEQREIVACLDAEGAKTDKAIGAVTRQIGLLKEYRTRLISDAVTGRIDLRKL